MINITTYNKYTASIIAQSDSGGYDPSGYVAVVDGEDAALSSFSHCSCFGTWESLTGGGISSSHYSGEYEPNWDWVGTVDELVHMAKNELDPSFPERKIDSSDYHSSYLMNVYQQILEWAKSRV